METTGKTGLNFLFLNNYSRVRTEFVFEEKYALNLWGVFQFTNLQVYSFKH